MIRGTPNHLRQTDFRSIPISANVCASEEGAEERVKRGNLKKKNNVTQARIQKGIEFSFSPPPT